jgi:hypothetical protein
MIKQNAAPGGKETKMKYFTEISEDGGRLMSCEDNLYDGYVAELETNGYIVIDIDAELYTKLAEVYKTHTLNSDQSVSGHGKGVAYIADVVAIDHYYADALPIGGDAVSAVYDSREIMSSGNQQYYDTCSAVQDYQSHKGEIPYLGNNVAASPDYYLFDIPYAWADSDYGSNSFDDTECRSKYKENFEGADCDQCCDSCHYCDYWYKHQQDSKVDDVLDLGIPL